MNIHSNRLEVSVPQIVTLDLELSLWLALIDNHLEELLENKQC